MTISSNQEKPTFDPQTSSFIYPPELVKKAQILWEKILGSDNVKVDEPTIDHFAQCTLPQSTRPLAILRPASVPEIQQIVQVARETGIPLYPISRGKNWGYGDACAVTNNQVILDLSRMNRILEVNTPLAYAVVEPGVTQGQLYTYLRENNIPLWLDATGAGPDASIVGNTLERGYGHTPYGDHFRHTCGMEVVLADGQLLKTGFGGYENTKAAHVFPWGLGPWLDGLFTQSNFGIVTKLGFWLLPKPDVCQAFAFSIPNDDLLPEVVDRLRMLRLSGVVRSTVHVANDLRVLSARQRYPWDLAKGVTPLPEPIRQQLRQQAGLGAWNALGGLYGTKKEVAAARSKITKVYKGLTKVYYFSENKLNFAQKWANFLNNFGLGKTLQTIVQHAKPVFDLLVGCPSKQHLLGVEWRSKTTPSTKEPDPSKHGTIWLAPVLPMTGGAGKDLLQLIQPIFATYQFEPLITFATITDRALCCVLNICFDNYNSEDKNRARQCYDALFNTLASQGYLPYRLGISAMSKLHNRSPVFWDVVNKIKQVFDNQGILAPGRYHPLFFPPKV